MKIKSLPFFSCLVLISIIYSCELDSEFASGEVPTISNLAISSPDIFDCDLPCVTTFSATSQLAFPVNPGDQASYSWDFGDGSDVMTGNDIMHEYTSEGEYEITLTATAEGANDVSINQDFIVNPKSTFIGITDSGLLGMDVAEISDGFIVFGLFNIAKFDNEGTLKKIVDVRNSIPDFYYGDYHQLSENDFMLVAHDDGMRATVDRNLNIFDVTAGFYGSSAWVTAVVDQNGELIQLGNTNFGSNDGFYGALQLIPTGGPPAVGGDPNYWVDGYTGWAGNEPIPGIRPPKHIQIDDQFYMPVNTITGDQIFGYNEGYKYYDNLSLGTIYHISDGQDNNMLVLAYDESFKTVLLEIDKTTGATGERTELCGEMSPGIPQGLTKTADGYIIVTKVNAFSDCASEFNLDNQVLRIRKLDFQYDIVWDKLIEIENSAGIQIEMIKEADSGGFLLTGTVRQFSKDNLLLIKTNSEGIVN